MARYLLTEYDRDGHVVGPVRYADLGLDNGAQDVERSVVEVVDALVQTFYGPRTTDELEALHLEVHRREGTTWARIWPHEIVEAGVSFQSSTDVAGVTG